MKSNSIAKSFKKINSPVGKLTIVSGNEGLEAVLWENETPHRVRLGRLHEDPSHPILRETEKQLLEYFAGQRNKFSLPLKPSGTDFQKKVWQALLTIPYGETRTYGEVAQQIGKKNASRAVGAANKKNPLSIIVPCHRVIGRSGKLTGFAGGLSAKAQLLNLERALFV